MRPNMKMKHVAIARMLVGYKLTEMALTIAAHKLLLKNKINAITIAWNCVRKFNATEQPAEIVIQIAENQYVIFVK